MTDRTAYRAVLTTIALERFAWYLMLGCLVLWRNPQAVGNLLFAGYLLPLLGGVVGRYSLRASVLTGCLISLAGYIAASANLSALALPLLAPRLSASRLMRWQSRSPSGPAVPLKAMCSTKWARPR